MRYDVYEIARIVALKKKRFLIFTAIYSFLFVSFIVLPLILNNKSLIIAGAAFAAVCIFLEARLFDKFKPKIIFSREMVGVNIKEYEYNLSKGRGKPIYRRFANLPHTYENAKNPPLRLGGTVYLRLEDGNIAEIGGLYKKHIDFYEDGDILFKHGGTKYPEVISRETNEQPCPICGKINEHTLDKCAACGLLIVKE